MTDHFDDARDAAQAAVTAVLGGDRELAFDIVTEFEDPLQLALVLVDFTAFVHNSWARSTTVPREQAWQWLMTDVAEWREMTR